MIRSSMETFFWVAAALGCVVLAGCMNNDEARTARAYPTQPGATPAATKGNNVCIQTYQIDHTTIPDDNTILFYMKGGKIWKNTLPYRCPDLKFQGGFQYTTDINEICSNLQTIRVINQGGGPFLGSVCQLGEFTPYTPPPKPSSG
ncbi:MAG TPA: DUF6491 family protein [Alphaproteobacteria bacterium]|nr:DUF6491 family protein [Alphaproteobacteria bacterium]